MNYNSCLYSWRYVHSRDLLTAVGDVVVGVTDELDVVVVAAAIDKFVMNKKYDFSDVCVARQSSPRHHHLDEW